MTSVPRFDPSVSFHRQSEPSNEVFSEKLEAPLADSSGSYSLLAIIVGAVAAPFQRIGSLFSSVKFADMEEEIVIDVEEVQNALLRALKGASTAAEFDQIIRYLSSLNSLFSRDCNKIFDQVPTGCFLTKEGALSKSAIFKQVDKDLARVSNVEYVLDGIRFKGNSTQLLEMLQLKCNFSEQQGLAFMTFLQQGVLMDISGVMHECFHFVDKDIHVVADNPSPSEQRIGYSYYVDTSVPSILIRQCSMVCSLAEKNSPFHQKAPFAFFEGFLSLNFANKTAVSGWKIKEV
jgi:hypothetical protein